LGVDHALFQRQRRSACLGRLEEFNAMLKRYLAATNAPRLVNEHQDAWRRSPVMMR
jgi:polar amino acid transport system substrate-binding protein